MADASLCDCMLLALNVDLSLTFVDKFAKKRFFFYYQMKLHELEPTQIGDFLLDSTATMTTAKPAPLDG